MVELITKPWGTEMKWAHTAHYVGKIITVLPDQRLSVQFHREKVETMLVIEGYGYVNLYSMDEDGEPTLTSSFPMRLNDTIHIPPKQIHSLVAGPSGITVVEVSTNHLNDLVRLQDSYGRI